MILPGKAVSGGKVYDLKLLPSKFQSSTVGHGCDRASGDIRQNAINQCDIWSIPVSYFYVRVFSAIPAISGSPSLILNWIILSKPLASKSEDICKRNFLILLYSVVICYEIFSYFQ